MLLSLSGRFSLLGLSARCNYSSFCPASVSLRQHSPLAVAGPPSRPYSCAARHACPPSRPSLSSPPPPSPLVSEAPLPPPLPPPLPLVSEAPSPRPLPLVSEAPSPPPPPFPRSRLWRLRSCFRPPSQLKVKREAQTAAASDGSSLQLWAEPHPPLFLAVAAFALFSFSVFPSIPLCFPLSFSLSVWPRYLPPMTAASAVPDTGREEPQEEWVIDGSRP